MLKKIKNNFNTLDCKDIIIGILLTNIILNKTDWDFLVGCLVFTIIVFLKGIIVYIYNYTKSQKDESELKKSLIFIYPYYQKIDNTLSCSSYQDFKDIVIKSIPNTKENIFFLKNILHNNTPDIFDSKIKKIFNNTFHYIAVLSSRSFMSIIFAVTIFSSIDITPFNDSIANFLSQIGINDFSGVFFLLFLISFNLETLIHNDKEKTKNDKNRVENRKHMIELILQILEDENK